MFTALISTCAAFGWLTAARRSKPLREVTERSCLLLKILRQQQELLATEYLQLLRAMVVTVALDEHLPLTLPKCLALAGANHRLVSIAQIFERSAAFHQLLKWMVSAAKIDETR